VDDPSGQSDEVFAETIKKIEEKVLRLKEKMKSAENTLNRIVFCSCKRIRKRNPFLQWRTAKARI